MKILIVEDDLLITDLLKEYLDDANYSYLCAENGVQGLEVLEANPDVDIILLDRMMPEMSGMEFMEKMQQNDVFKHIPVIMQTAAGEIPEIIEGSQTGIYYYMTKPYSEELLLSVLRSAYKDKEDGKTISESLEKTLGNTNSTEAT